MVNSIRLELLGSSAVYLADREHLQKVGLPTQKALGLLAYLALCGPTTRSKLANLLWSEQSEDEARKNLRQEVYRLQDTPLREWLEVERTTLSLRHPFSSDVQTFDGLLSQGQSHKALEIYRGPLLDGIELRGASEFEDWLEVERENLAQRYREALLAQAQAWQQAGNLREALSIFRRLLKEDELQELYHREVIGLHYQLGERSEALAQYERCREILWQELALEPLPETQALESLIRSSQGIEATQQKPVSQRLVLNPIIVGREELWNALEASSARLKLLVGEAGIGKTRLAEEYARSKGRVLVLKGREVSSGTPFYPVSEALWAFLEQQPDALHSLPKQWRSEVERFLPGKSNSTPEPEGRGRFLEGLTQALLTLLGEDGCVVLDDLHWWDASSAELLSHVLGRSKQHKLIATARPQELEENPAIGKLLQGLAREDWLRLEVEGLSENAVQRLVGQLSGNFEAALFAKHLHRSTSGNPFFVLETLRHLMESGELYQSEEGWATPYDDVTQDYRELPIPPGVHEAVSQRIGRLGAASKRLLEAAALAGDGFGLELLSEATALTDWEGLEALESTVRAQLVQPAEKGYRFVHDIVRRSLDGGLSPERRKLIHRKLAASLEHLNGASAQVAYHLEQSTQFKSAIPWRVKAAEEAARVYAYPQAVSHYQKALDHGPDDHDAFRIRLALVRLWDKLDDQLMHTAEIEALHELAGRLGEPALQVEVVLARTQLACRNADFALQLQTVEPLLERSELSSQHRARAFYEAGYASRQLARLDHALSYFESALDSEADPLLSARIRHMLSYCLADQGKIHEAWEQNQMAVDYYRSKGDVAGEANVLGMAVRLGSLLPDFEKAEAAARRGLELAKEAQLPKVYRSQLMNLGSILSNGFGRFEEGRTLQEEALKLAREAGDELGTAGSLGNLSVTHKNLGNLGQFLNLSREGMALYGKLGVVYNCCIILLNQADCLLDCGEPLQARVLLEEAQGIIRERGLSELSPRLEAVRVACELMQGNKEIDLGYLKNFAHNRQSAHRAWEYVVWVLTRVHLWRGEPQQALEALAKVDQPLRLADRLLAVHLEAQALLGRSSETNLERAFGLLGSTTLAALEKLHLYRAILKALGASGNRAELQKRCREAETLVAKMARSLEPSQAQRFSRHWLKQFEVKTLEAVV